MWTTVDSNHAECYFAIRLDRLFQCLSTGVHCEINVDDCASNPCQHNGTCTDLVNAFLCTCTPEFVGSTCAEPYCSQDGAQSLCLNGGVCYGAGLCDCPPRYIGSDCSVDRCDVIGCRNGGNCTENGTCSCPAGFVGIACEISVCSMLSCEVRFFYPFA